MPNIWWRALFVAFWISVVCGIGPADAAVVGYWPLDDGLLNSTTTTVADASGNGRDGILELLSQPWVDGEQARSGGAINFGDQLGYTKIDVSDALPTDNQPRTLAAWILAPDAADAKFLSYGFAKPGRRFDFSIEMSDGTPHVFFRHWGGNMRYPNAVVGEFMHFAVVVPEGAEKTSDVQVFINGQQSLGFRGQGNDWRLNTGPSDLVIGARSDVFDFFDGVVDDVWLFDEALDEFNIRSVMRGTYGILPGDFNENGRLDVDDVNQLTMAISEGSADSEFDIDGNGALELNDRSVWLHDLKNTSFGDSNLNGIFDSDDLVLVFQVGEYEDQVPLNSTWEQGDWDGNGDFDTADFVTAFVDGGYVGQPSASVRAVPEPTAWLLTLSGASLLWAVGRTGRSLRRAKRSKRNAASETHQTKRVDRKVIGAEDRPIRRSFDVNLRIEFR